MKRLARLVLLAGGIAIGFFIFGANPRDVTLVYALHAPARSVEVEIFRDGKSLRLDEFRFPAPQKQATQKVKLPPGDYRLRLWVVPADGPAGPLERSVSITEIETIVVPL